MHSRFRIPADIHQQHHHQQEPAEESSSAHQMSHQAGDDDDILEHIRRGGATSSQPPLFMNHYHHTFPPPPQHHHHYHYVGPQAPPAGGVAPSSLFGPLNFKLGVNEYCSRISNVVVEEHQQQRRRRSYHNNEVGGGGSVGGVRSGCSINEGADNAAALLLPLLRGSEQYTEEAAAVPETTTTPRHTITNSSLGMLHCWQNQEDSSIKQPHFWELAEVSNENSEIVDNNKLQQENSEKNDKHAAAAAEAMANKSSRVHFGELEAIYNKRLIGSSSTTTADESDQTGPTVAAIGEPPVTNSIGGHHRLQQQQELSACNNIQKSGRKRKKKKKHGGDAMIDPMTEFFGNLVKQVMEHQENLHRKFAEAVERLDAERRRREEAWRSQEIAHFEREAAERARERGLAEGREATVISYLEKITGEKIINLPPKFDPTS